MNVLEDKIYDTAVCLEVLEHVQNHFEEFKEIYHILKKDGYLIL